MRTNSYLLALACFAGFSLRAGLAAAGPGDPLPSSPSLAAELRAADAVARVTVVACRFLDGARPGAVTTPIPEEAALDATLLRTYKGSLGEPGSHVAFRLLSGPLLRRGLDHFHRLDADAGITKPGYECVVLLRRDGEGFTSVRACHVAGSNPDEFFPWYLKVAAADPAEAGLLLTEALASVCTRPGMLGEPQPADLCAAAWRPLLEDWGRVASNLPRTDDRFTRSVTGVYDLVVSTSRKSLAKARAPWPERIDSGCALLDWLVSSLDEARRRTLAAIVLEQHGVVAERLKVYHSHPSEPAPELTFEEKDEQDASLAEGALLRLLALCVDPVHPPMESADALLARARAFASKR